MQPQAAKGAKHVVDAVVAMPHCARAVLEVYDAMLRDSCLAVTERGKLGPVEGGELLLDNADETILVANNNFSYLDGLVMPGLLQAKYINIITTTPQIDCS